MKRKLRLAGACFIFMTILAGCEPAGNDGADPSTFPSQMPPESVQRIKPAEYGKEFKSSDGGTGAFRTNCKPLFVSYDDPIVYPGTSNGSSHLHVFYGNAQTNENDTEIDSMVNEPSSCAGGTLNSTGYWMPAMLNVVGDAPWDIVSNYATPCPSTPNTACAGDRSNSIQVYYKDGYDGVEPLETDYPTSGSGAHSNNPCCWSVDGNGNRISPDGWEARDVQNFPPGLRIITGDSMANEPQSELGSAADAIHWYCFGQGVPSNQSPGFDDGRYNTGGHVIPQCQVGHLLGLEVLFPQCWDGEHLTDHDKEDDSMHSHMSYAVGWPDRGCPTTHPIPLPQITTLFRWRVPASGMANWKLASDMMHEGVEPGTTAHSDWYNGWNADIFQQMLDNCYNKPDGWRDCSMNLVGPFTANNTTPQGSQLYSP